MAYKYAHTAKGKDGSQTAGYRIEFIPHSPLGAPQKPKATLWFPGATDDEASRILAHIDHMLEQLAANEPFEKSTAAWLRQLPDRPHSRFAKYGFCNPRKITKPEKEKPVRVYTLDDLFERFKKTIGNRKPATQTKLIQAMDCLSRYPGFGPSKPLSEITFADAEEWRVWLLTKGNIREGKKRKDKNGKLIQGRIDLSENTVRRRSGLAKQIFGFAIKLKWIQENPFDELVAAVTANEKRQYFVDRETIAKAIDVADDEHWKGIIAVARFGGLRIPSEIAGLRWMDIDFEAGRIRVHSPKTEHHAGRAVRWCPMFPELRPYLQALAEIAKPGIETPLSAPVFPGCEKATNLRTKFERILKRAGIEKWPKLFQNLRASCETELLQKFDAKNVCSWIGNTQAVAMKHYAMATDAIFQRATKELSGIDPQKIDVSENRKKNRKSAAPGDLMSDSDQPVVGGGEEENPHKNAGFDAHGELENLQETRESGRRGTRIPPDFINANNEKQGIRNRCFDHDENRKKNRKTLVEASPVRNQILELLENVSPEQEKQILETIKNVLTVPKNVSSLSSSEAGHVSQSEHYARMAQMDLALSRLTGSDQPPPSSTKRNRTP